jgi:regulation of enolase protein 1 (concanavalin A-like superfamily)
MEAEEGQCAPNRRRFLAGAAWLGTYRMLFRDSENVARSSPPDISARQLFGEALLAKMRWLNPPASSRQSGGQITAVSKAKSDFWQKTRYHYSADNGHFLRLSVAGDFAIQARVVGEYRTLYDQAGMMIRLNSGTWLKCGLVFVNGVGNAVTVVTRDYSDWSTVPGFAARAPLWWRIVRRDRSLEVLYSADARSYMLVRVGYLPLPLRVDVGVMCASPEGEGFPCTFDELHLELRP